MTNLLEDTQGVLTFDQYTVSDFWTGSIDDDGYPVLSAEIETIDALPYSLEFSMAANVAADVVDVTIEVYFDGALIGDFDHSGAEFIEQQIDFMGTGSAGVLEFKILDNTSGSGNQNVDTSGVVASYSKTMTIMGEDVDVDAFLPGQSYVYQVLHGQLNVFDPETNTYTETEYKNSVTINAMGYSTDYDMIFGHVKASGTDSLGNEISSGDLVALDARGATYLIAETPYAHYIGDFDDQGNLWTFSGNLNLAVRYDLSAIESGGAPVITTFSLPETSAPTSGLADLGFNASTQTFYGVGHTGSNGGDGTLFEVDISQLTLGGAISIDETVIVGTITDSGVEDGIPAGAYGAMAVDSEGKIYAGLNQGNHDLDGSTSNSGGFYEVVTAEDGQLYMQLISDAPLSSKNDGAMDPRAVDPFLGVDDTSTVLLREPVVSLALAEDDMAHMASKGNSKTIDLLANDYVSEGETLQVIKVNGETAYAGQTFTLENGETVVYNGDGSVTVSPDALATNVAASFTYTIQNDRGVEDTGTVTVTTSPVDGTGADDQMITFTDADGDAIDGADGPNDVILGYGGDDKIFSGDGDDDIYGGSGDDFIRAEDGDDFIDGGDGNDVVDGGTGNDTMIGGEGDDVYYIYDIGDVLQGETGGYDKVKSAYDHTLAAGFEELWLIDETDAVAGTGNAEDNTLIGNENDNTLSGLGGDDYLDADYGDDVVLGGAGADLIFGRDGNDDLSGDEGNDKIEAGDGNDDLNGGSGDDTLRGEDGNDNVVGGAGNDLVDGGTGADTMSGGRGNDVFYVDDAGDVLTGETDGYDKVKSEVDFTLEQGFEFLKLINGSSAIFGTGSNGNDLIRGNENDNIITGLDGADTLNGQGGDDAIWGGDNNDKLLGRAGSDVLYGEDGDDRVCGGSGNDTVFGGDGNDKVCANNGQDIIVGGDGDDTLSGGNDNDTLDGGDGDDKLKVGDGSDLMFGGAGMDTLRSGEGENEINGGTGNDYIVCDAAGIDTFVYADGDGNDRVYNFDIDQDAIVFSGLSEDDVTVRDSKSHLEFVIGDDAIIFRDLAGTELSDFDITFI